MPELPDVEIFRKVAEKAKNSAIDDFEILDKKFVEISGNDFNKNLKGNKFKEVLRRGKYLFLKPDSNSAVVMHFGMTGFLKYLKEDEDAPDYTKCSFHFKNKHKLHYISKRKLGHIQFAGNLEEFIKKKELGPDALEINESDFVAVLKGKNSMLKTALTDQSAIAGIGNVYADEILFQAKLHPKMQTGKLRDADLKELYNITRKVLEKAVEKNAEVGKLPKSYLLPNRKEGADCPKCSGKIKKITVSGRTTLFCPTCQHE